MKFIKFFSTLFITVLALGALNAYAAETPSADKSTLKKRTVFMRGLPVTIAGQELKAGDKAPAFTVIDGSLQPVSLETFKGKIKVISVTPSLDTPVCDGQIRKFNSDIAGLGPEYVVINISTDLPFAIKRFCEVAGIDNVIAASDHRDVSFGRDYGVLIEEYRILTRAVFIVDENDIVTYAEYLPDNSQSPDFDKIMETLKN